MKGEHTDKQQSQISSKKSIESQLPLHGDNTEEEEEDFLEFSEMIANTQQSQDNITPSDFGYTPKSTFDNKSTAFNPDASFDYSIIQIEFMADNNNNTNQTQ